MKIFFILSLLFCKQLCSENISASKPVSNECKQKNHQLVLENDQLQKTIAVLKIENGLFQKTIADLKTENAKLKADLFESSALAKETKFLSQNFKILSIDIQHFKSTLDQQLMNYKTYSKALAKDAEYLTNNLKTLSDVMNLFNAYIDNQLVNYAMKNGIEQSRCQCMPKKFFGIRFIPNLKFYNNVCDVKNSNGTWTVIQRRMDGSVDFNRGWADYKAGFGTITGEFFIGLDNLHELTTCTRQELLLEMQDHENRKWYAKYDLFLIGNETEKYKMKKLGKYEGNAHDTLSNHKSQKFSTFDQDNDKAPYNCAARFKGGWWYKHCHYTNLNGQYGNNEKGKGINVFLGGQGYSIKKVEMKIRPKK